MEALVLGIRSVLVSEQTFQTAAIEAAGECLHAVGVDRGRFRAAALVRLERHGGDALIARTLQDLNFRLPARWVRQATQAAAASVPHVRPDSDLLSTLRYLQSATRLALLDEGPSEALEGVVSQLKLADVTECRLWTDQLGRDVGPPRPYAFRWMTRRLALPAAEVLYVAGTRAAQHAAQAAGWQSVRAQPKRVGELEWLVCRLEMGAIDAF